MEKLSSSSKETIQHILDSNTGPKTGVPGLAFVAIDKHGDYLTQQFAGKRSLQDSSPKIDADTVFWIASCTKMITGLACMQLVEQGKLELDNAESVYKLAPEIKEKKVLKSDGTLEDRKGDITLRMLLDHTAGFGYSFFNEKLRDMRRPTGWDEFAGDAEDLLEQPLVNQPGERWEYGVNIDWAGVLVERASGLSLNDYFQKQIFEPLGVKNVSFIPDKHMRENMVHMVQRDSSGKATDADHALRRGIHQAERPKTEIFQSGGGGCFANPAEYCKIIATLLNDGTSPTTGAKILSKESVDKMFTNSIPQFPDFARQRIPAAKPHLTNEAPELYPQAGNPPQGWGLTFMITQEPGATGRGANTGWWAGITNLFWWCDREQGVGGMIAGQVLPFGDMNVMGAWAEAEKAVYDGLKSDLPIR